MTDSVMADAMLDAAALVTALRERDERACNMLLDTGDTRRMATVLAHWWCASLETVTAECAGKLVAAWRTMGEDRRDGWADYTGP